MFKVPPFTTFSDHKPCSPVLKHTHRIIDEEEIIGKFESCPTKYKWKTCTNSNLDADFLQKQQSDRFRAKADNLRNFHCSSPDDVYELNKKIIELYREVADVIIPRKPRYNQANNNKRFKSKKKCHRMKAKEPWFDGECINTKRALRNLTKKYGKSPFF